MFKKVVQMIFRLMLLTSLMAAAVIFMPRLLTGFYSWGRIFRLADAPARRVAVVFGAGLHRDGSPTPVLRDRVSTAAQLYQQGKVEKLLLSGDNRFVDYNEPAAMRDYALSLGVPPEDLVLDYAGRRTYDTCYRALHIFGVQEAVLVTQSFHMPRALYTCNLLGLPAVGVASDLRSYRRISEYFWNLRELPASLVAVWEVLVTRPLPVMGDPEPIFPMKMQ